MKRRRREVGRQDGESGGAGEEGLGGEQTRGPGTRSGPARPVAYMPRSLYVLKNSIWLHAWIQPTTQVSWRGMGGMTTRAEALK